MPTILRSRDFEEKSPSSLRDTEPVSPYRNGGDVISPNDISFADRPLPQILETYRDRTKSRSVSCIECVNGLTTVYQSLCSDR